MLGWGIIKDMHHWTKASIEIANASGYLDGLGEIYIMQDNPLRPLPKPLEKSVREAFAKRSTKILIKLLLGGEVFPVKDSYVGFLRKKAKAIDENPKTIERIGKRLYKLGIAKLIDEASRPKETNRQLGSAFRQGLHKLGYKMANEIVFHKTNKGVVFLDGSDAALKKYANAHLGCKLRKGIDILFKKDGRCVIGEAKFLTTPGGEQDRGFDDAESFINSKNGKATRIALIDGYVWLKTEKGLHDKIARSKLPIFSALLLKDFIKNF